MEKVVELVCKVFKMERDDVCDGISTSFAPHLYYIFTRSKISSIEQVSLLLGIDSCLDVQRFQSSKLNWLIHVPPTQPQQYKLSPSRILPTNHQNKELETNDHSYDDGDETNDVIDWMSSSLSHGREAMFQQISTTSKKKIEQGVTHSHQREEGKEDEEGKREIERVWYEGMS